MLFQNFRTCIKTDNFAINMINVKQYNSQRGGGGGGGGNIMFFFSPIICSTYYCQNNVHMCYTLNFEDSISPKEQ